MKSKERTNRKEKNGEKYFYVGLNEPWNSKVKFKENGKTKSFSMIMRLYVYLLSIANAFTVFFFSLVCTNKLWIYRMKSHKKNSKAVNLYTKKHNAEAVRQKKLTKYVNIILLLPFGFYVDTMCNCVCFIGKVTKKKTDAQQNSSKRIRLNCGTRHNGRTVDNISLSRRIIKI